MFKIRLIISFLIEILYVSKKIRKLARKLYIIIKYIIQYLLFLG